MQNFKVNLDKEILNSAFFPSENPQYTLILVHGMGEHFMRYANYVIPRLNKAGCNVYAYDHVGHGESSGKRGHTPSYEFEMKCISHFVELAKETNKEVLLYGHSMGGNCVINYSLKQDSRVSRYIVSSPMLALAFAPPLWKTLLGNIALYLAPKVTLNNGLDASKISKDPTEVKKYVEDPLNHDLVSPNFSMLFLKKGKYALKHKNLLNHPMLLLHGDADQITSFKASQNFALENKEVTFAPIKGGYHELHNDLEKKEFMNIIIKWIHGSTI